MEQENASDINENYIFSSYLRLKWLCVLSAVASVTLAAGDLF